MKSLQSIIDKMNMAPLKAHYVMPGDSRDPIILQKDVSEWENTAAGIDTCKRSDSFAWCVKFKGFSSFFTFAVDEIAAIERVKKSLPLGSKAPRIEGVKKVNHA